MSDMCGIQNDFTSLIEQIDSGAVSSESLTKSCLTQIERYNNDLGAVLWIDADGALKQARESDVRRRNKQALSRLDGIPIALKDMILMRGLPCTAGSKILEGYVPPYEAYVTEQLRKHGAVLLGKTNQDEFAMGSSNELSAYKTCRNPWDLTRTPGGSSGGSASAVSAQMCFASLGTDTGGSIRQPASFCGLVGVKPSYGRVSRFGVIAFASSLDQVGPFARSVRDAATVLSAISGYDPNDSTSANLPVPDYVSELKTDISGRKIGVPAEYFGEGLSSDVRAAVTRTITELKNRGADVVEISLPHTEYAVATYYVIATAEASSNLARYDGIRFGPRRGEQNDLNKLYEETRGQLFGAEVKRRIMLGTYVLSTGYYDEYYARAQKVRRLLANDFATAFKTVDVILSPTAPTTAFTIGEKVADPLAMYLNDIYTISANLAGICGISVPVGNDSSGLPIGLQFLAPAFCEQRLFDFAACVEELSAYDYSPPLVMNRGI